MTSESRSRYTYIFRFNGVVYLTTPSVTTKSLEARANKLLLELRNSYLITDEEYEKSKAKLKQVIIDLKEVKALIRSQTLQKKNAIEKAKQNADSQ